jgi:hypothetical protein
MFETLQAASMLNKYQVPWVELAPVQFQTVIPKWFGQLAKSAMMSGPPQAQRVALANEFYRLLYIQKQVLAAQSGNSMSAQRAQVNIDWFASEYKKKFGSELKAPPPQEAGLDALLNRRELLSLKLELLEQKLQLVNYWIRGASQFPEHREGASLLFQYMGNAPREKVRLFLEVMCADAQKALEKSTVDSLKTSFSVTRGLQTAGEHGKLYKIDWTDDSFKKAVKAEIGASYGIQAKKSCELEFKGIKAQLDATAWAGARAKASGELSRSVSGFSAKASVEAEIGVKLTAEAKIDCANIFLCEASAEAFAGAMAKADIEVTATVSGVTAKLSAEAFAGARLTGKASMTLKFGGEEIFKVDAQGSLTAGIGAKAGLEFQASIFGGTSLKLDAGVTLGVGAETSSKFTVNTAAAGPALQSVFYASYLELTGERKKAYAYVTYFREIEANVRLFEKAREVIEKEMAGVITERNQLFTEFAAWKQLEGLASFRATGRV